MENPFFSIITTSFNYERFVGQTIESVLNQTFQDWELILVDDCSGDDSWSIISRYGDPRIRAFRFEKNRGACSAYNYGLARARSRFVASLDSDDLFSPEKLARQHAFLIAHPDVDICGTWLLEIDPDGNRVGEDALIYEPWFNIHVDLNDPASWIWKNRLCHSSSVVRRALHDQVGPFREDLIYTPDWQFWLRALVAGARFAVIEEPLTLYRNHGSNITHKRPMGTVEEYARTCAAIFHPHLFGIGRLDLIQKNLYEFLRSRPFNDAAEPVQRDIVRTIVGFGSDQVAARESQELVVALLLDVARERLKEGAIAESERQRNTTISRGFEEQIATMRLEIEGCEQNRIAAERSCNEWMQRLADANARLEETVRARDCGFLDRENRISALQNALADRAEMLCQWVERSSLSEQELTHERQRAAAMLRAHEDAQRSFEEALQRAGDREAAVHKAHRASLQELDAVNERFRAASCRIEVLLEDQRALTTQSAERMATVEKLEGELQSLRNRVAELEENRVDLLKHLEELAIPARRYFKLRSLFPEPLRRIGRKGLQVVRQMKGK